MGASQVTFSGDFGIDPIAHAECTACEGRGVVEHDREELGQVAQACACTTCSACQETGQAVAFVAGEWLCAGCIADVAAEERAISLAENDLLVLAQYAAARTKALIAAGKACTYCGNGGVITPHDDAGDAERLCVECLAKRHDGPHCECGAWLDHIQEDEGYCRACLAKFADQDSPRDRAIDAAHCAWKADREDGCSR